MPTKKPVSTKKAGAAKGAALLPATSSALDEAAAFDWKAASAGRVPKLGADFARLVDPKPANREQARASILATAGEHPIGGVLAPYVVRLFSDPGAPDRADLLPLMTVIAVGKPAIRRFDASAFAAGLRRSRRERFQAMAQAGPAALPLLDDADEKTRVAAAMFVAYAQPDGWRSRVRAAIDGETSPLALGTALIAFGMGAGESPTEDERSVLAPYLSHGDPHVALSAAIALAVFPGSMDEATLARLEAGLATSGDVWPGFPWLAGGIGSAAAERYLALSDRHPDRVIARASAGLAGAVEIARPLAKQLVELLLPRPHPTGTPLSSATTTVLRAILSQPGLADQALRELLAKLGLPGEDTELRDFVGLEIPAPPSLVRTIDVDGQKLPAYLAWCRWCWGRLRADPGDILKQALDGLTAEQTMAAFRALTAAPSTVGVRPTVAVPPELGGQVTLRYEMPFKNEKIPTARLVDFLVGDGWEPIFDGEGAWLGTRGGLVLHVGPGGHLLKVVTWTQPYVSIPRLIAAWAYERLGEAFVDAAAMLAVTDGLENMTKWWTLELVALLAQLSGRPPDPACDELFRRCFVSQVVNPWRVAYLRAVPPERAEELALWYLSKTYSANATWIASVVPTDAVKARIAAKTMPSP